jgi:hypothetical protein
VSQENVELRYRADLDALLALCDPDVVFISRHLGLEGGGGRRHGHDAVRSWWESMLGVFPDFSTELDEVLLNYSRSPAASSASASVRKARIALDEKRLSALHEKERSSTWRSLVAQGSSVRAEPMAPMDGNGAWIPGSPGGPLS